MQCRGTVAKMILQLLIALEISFVISQDPCDRENRREIDGQTFRSANLTETSGSLNSDRSLDEGWYYFHASTGSQMVNYCVPLYHCGTKYPIWLIGENPRIEDGVVNRQVCTTDQYLECSCTGNQTECCSEIHEIQAKNCGAYFVYKLVKPPSTFTGYCVGDKQPQACLPPGATAATCKDVFTPIPQLTATQGKRPNNHIQEIQFHCKNSYDRNDLQIQFDVNWFIDGHLVKFERLNGGRRNSILHESDWVDIGWTLGFQVQCSLNGSYIGGPIAKRTTSKSYFAGFLIDGNTFQLKENTDAWFYVTPTVPMLPLKNCGADCTATLEVSVVEHPMTCMDGSLLPQVTVTDSCTITFNPKSHIPTNNMKFQLTAGVDGLYEKDHIVNIEVSPASLASIHPAWRGYNASFQVTVLDQDKQSSASRCEIMTGSFITTFDGHVFKMQQEGEFIFYRNQNLPFRVHVFQRRCGPSRTCTCGVAIMSATDNIVIDMCLPVSDPSRKPQLKVIQTGCDFMQGSLRLLQKNDGRGYEVYLPSGGYLEVLVFDNHLSVYLFPSSLDLRATEGLCGFYNKNCADDVRARGSTVSSGMLDECFRERSSTPAVRRYQSVVSSFRVPSADSLYRYTFDTTKYIPPSFGKPFCYCTSTDRKCRHLGHVQRCVSPEFSPTRDITTHHKNSCRRRRDLRPDGLVYLDDENSTPVFRFNPGFQAQAVSWPLPSGLTENDARQHCKNTLMSSALGTACSAVAMVDFLDKLLFCTELIKVTDDLTSTRFSVDSIKEHCIQELRRNTSAWVKVVSHDSSSYKWKLPPEFTNVLCMNNCSGQGNCNEGVCQCDPGFIGSDCSVPKAKPPDVYYIPNEGLCDIRFQPCAAALVVGHNFVYTDNLMCHFQLFSLTGIEVGIMTSKRAYFETFNRVVCVIPTNSTGIGHGYRLSISNDGQTQSKALQFVPFDSTCLECESSAQPPCKIKQNSCIADGRCVRDCGKGTAGSSLPVGSTNPSSVTSFAGDTKAATLPTTTSSTLTNTKTEGTSSMKDWEIAVLSVVLVIVIVSTAVTLACLRRKVLSRIRRKNYNEDVVVFSPSLPAPESNENENVYSEIAVSNPDDPRCGLPENKMIHPVNILDPAVNEFLKKLHLEKFRTKFAQEEITMDELPKLNVDDLRMRLGIPLGPAKVILDAIQGMRHYEELDFRASRNNDSNYVYTHLRQKAHSETGGQASDEEARSMYPHLNKSQTSSRIVETAGKVPKCYNSAANLHDDDPSTCGSMVSLVSNSSVISTGIASALPTEFPPYFKCALTKKIMKDPVRASDGYTYERTAISTWLKTHKESPVTGTVFQSRDIETCFELRRQIKDWQSQKIYANGNIISDVNC